MGAIRGSLTFSRLFVQGDVPSDLSSTAMRKIRSYSFRPMAPEEDDAIRHGWCSIQDPMDIELDHEKVFFNEYLCLGLRIDKWVVPKPLLTAHLRDAEAALLEKKGLEKLGRKARADLKMMVIKKLRRQLVPSTKAVDLVWNTTTNVAHFWSASPTVQERVLELFEQTFKLRLLPESPAIAADRAGFTDEESRVFDALEPTSLSRAVPT